MIKTLVCFVILLVFLYGICFYGAAPHAFFPSLRLLQDTQWNPSFFWGLSAEKALALFLCIPIGLGFLGWACFFQKLFFPKIENRIAKLLGLSLGLSFFSFYVFGLAINEVLYKPLVFLFFIPTLWKGWMEWKTVVDEGKKVKTEWGFSLLALPLLLWTAEYLSPPIIWDAVLDHFRYAREVSRLHQVPLYWTNHTGDMPKAAELVLAGFWSMGGESFSKLSSALAAVGAILLIRLFSIEWKGSVLVSNWIFWTCPFFLAVFSWGYVEGFLAVYELLALYCFWKAVSQGRETIWLFWGAFFLGFSLSIKYTALLAGVALFALWVCWKFMQRLRLKLDWAMLAFFFIPVLPWLLKNEIAYGNPLYPLATSVFGTPYGYGQGMESGLLQDTGLPQNLGFGGRLVLFWKVFFTSDNAVGACWTPLVWMSLPWGLKAFKSKLGIFLLLFAVFFFTAWALLCTSLRHASGGTLVLVLVSAMAWTEVFREKRTGSKVVFVAGVLLSLWLCLSAQLTATAPYPSALGLEDPLSRLKRHYTYDVDTYSAYRFIEEHSDSLDKVMAFAVFQTYPLQRTAYVDFKWKRPIFLEWASQCKTAEQLARKLHEEGVRYFLYQQWEANAMSHMEKDFNLEGMPAGEYERFWEYFMEPVEGGKNSTVYEARTTPLAVPRKLSQLPGLQEKGLWHPT